MLTKRTMIISAMAMLACVLLPLSRAHAQETPAQKLRVVATFSILGDMTARIGGDGIELATLVGPNGDAHVYSPSPDDARRIAQAQVIIANGLGFEGWMSRLIRASGTKAMIVEAARNIKPLKASDDDHGHNHGTFDPHAWQSIANAKIYVANIRDALIAADEKSRATFEANAKAYLAELESLEQEIKQAVSRIPQERRKLITSHDAFSYFARDTSIQFISPQGVSTESEASARDVARIIRQIKRDNIRAVFIETIGDPRLAERIAKETGAILGGKLYSDALSDKNGEAPTYIDMMRHNIRVIADALSR